MERRLADFQLINEKDELIIKQDSDDNREEKERNGERD
jgi:hypothetical protein